MFPAAVMRFKVEYLQLEWPYCYGDLHQSIRKSSTKGYNFVAVRIVFLNVGFR